jgi:hypothetical protein
MEINKIAQPDQQLILRPTAREWENYTTLSESACATIRQYRYPKLLGEMDKILMFR